MNNRIRRIKLVNYDSFPLTQMKLADMFRALSKNTKNEDIIRIRPSGDLLRIEFENFELEMSIKRYFDKINE